MDATKQTRLSQLVAVAIGLLMGLCIVSLGTRERADSPRPAATATRQSPAGSPDSLQCATK